MLHIRWLEDLAAIAEYRNLTKAAEKRHVTQSGLSRRLQSLERWAGASLIDRSKNPIYLTKAGEELLATSSEVVGRLNETRRAIRDDADERLTAVRFAAPHVLSVAFFPKWLPVLQRQVGPLFSTSDPTASVAVAWLLNTARSISSCALSMLEPTGTAPMALSPFLNATRYSWGEINSFRYQFRIGQGNHVIA